MRLLLLLAALATGVVVPGIAVNHAQPLGGSRYFVRGTVGSGDDARYVARIVDVSSGMGSSIRRRSARHRRPTLQAAVGISRFWMASAATLTSPYSRHKEASTSSALTAG